MWSQLLELLKFYGHGKIQQAELAGLLSECGYKGEYLKKIVERAPAPPSGTSFIHQSTILRPVVPESNAGCGLAFCLICICVVGPIVCLGQHYLRPQLANTSIFPSAPLVLARG